MKRIHYILTSLFSCLLFMGCQDVEEPANTLPTVKTDAVTEIGIRNAIVTGSVSSHSICKFLLSTQLDLSDALEFTAICTDEGQGLYKGDLNQLMPNTTYYVALCATDGYSEIKGNVLSFQTISCLGIADVMLADWNTGALQPFDKSIASFLYTTQEPEWHFDGRFTVEYGNSWHMSPSQDIYFYGSKKRFYACHPLNENVQDVTKISLSANMDFVYGSSEELSESNPNAHIALKHAMAKVSFAVKKSTDNLAEFVLGTVNLRNNYQMESTAISLSAIFNLLTGEMAREVIAGHDGLFFNGEAVLDSDKPVNVDFYVFPTNFAKGEVMLNLYGKNDWSNSFSNFLDDSKWEEGKHYTYPVTLTSVGLQIGDVRVEEWQNNEGGSIIINQ